MNIADWGIMGLYACASIALGVYFSRRAGRNTREFFQTGRSIPWWLAGLSMVATTFAADTPLAVTELTATHGVAGNWLWWNMAIGGMFTVFFFARFWHRSGILTDVEFIELRYSGKPAAFLRGFRAVYLGLFMNAVIMGWVNVAMSTIIEGMFGIPHGRVIWYVAAAMAVTAIYSSLGGLWGVTVTDAFQFFLAMTGCIVLAILVVQSPEIGGMNGLTHALPAASLRFFPTFDAASGATGVLSISAGAFFAYIGVQWWSSWYPGAEPGGGGYIAQRIMSTRNERHSVYSVLFFQIAHFCLRPWPWIVVALASLVLFPQLDPSTKKLGYVYAMNRFLPSGFRGLMVAAFFAAYMSTIATHLNWGTSYLVHDFWRRFVRPGRTERSYVRVSRTTTILLMIVSLGVTFVIDTISGAWLFILECGAGLGLVLMLRWYWWRVNAWSEIAATGIPALAYAAILVYNGVAGPDAALVFPTTLFAIVAITTVGWIAMTFATEPESDATLGNFYDTVRPGGIGWRAFASRTGRSMPPGHFASKFTGWFSGVALVYSVLFGTGSLLFGQWTSCALWTAFACVAAVAVTRSIGRTGRDDDAVAA